MPASLTVPLTLKGPVAGEGRVGDPHAASVTIHKTSAIAVCCVRVAEA
ncbi:MAG: hypothetical protein QM736_10280 [Vicinamibacterales bacterium]